MNPEMDHNILEINKTGFGKFLTYEKMQNNLLECLDNYFANEIDIIKKNLNSTDLQFNGAEIIHNKILNYLNDDKRLN